MIPEEMDLPFGWGEPEDGLAPSRYTVRVKQRVIEKGLWLISNRIEFTVD